MDDREFCAVLRIERRICEQWIEREWLLPAQAETGGRRYSEVDLARARLLIDLEYALGVNAEGIDVIVHLIDQMYGMRVAVADLVRVLAAEPEPVRTRIVAEAERRRGLGGGANG